MESKLKVPALQVAGWGLLHGDFFDLYDVAEHLLLSVEVAGKVILYLRSFSEVETVAETRSCTREPGKSSTHRIFIKVRSIHPEKTKPVKHLPPPKSEPIQQRLTHLVKFMPLPPGSR